MRREKLIRRILTVALAFTLALGNFGYSVYADDWDGDGIDEEEGRGDLIPDGDDEPLVGPDGMYDPAPNPDPAPDPGPYNPGPVIPDPEPDPPAPEPEPQLIQRQTPAVNVDLTYRVVSYIPDRSIILFGEGMGWKDCSGNYGISEELYNMMYNYCCTGASFPISVIAKGDYVTTSDSEMQTVYVSFGDFPQQQHTKRATPGATYDTVTQILSGIPECSRYSLDGGSSWSDYVSGSVTVTGVSQHYEILVVACGRLDTEDDSDPEVIWIEKSDAPVGVSPIHVSAVGGTGGLNNVAAGEEYCVSGTNNWIAIGGNPVMGLAPGSYDVRVKAHGNFLASDKVTVTINGFTPAKEPTPNATFDGAHYRIGNLTVGMAYSLDRANWSKITDGNCTSVTISRAQAETAIAHGGILVKKCSNGSTTIDSDIQTLVITEAKVPTGLSVIPAVSGGTGGIGNLSNDMEMSQDMSNWYSLAGMSGTMVPGLKPGIYYIRRRANGTQICSDIVTINLGSSTANKEAKPSSVFNAATMNLSDIMGCKISLDNGKNWSSVMTVSNITIEESKLNLNYGIQVKRPGNGVTTSDSDILKIPLGKQATPSGIGGVSATNSLGGAITGLTNAMEYRAEKASAWITPASANVTGLASGKYYVRTKGYGNALPSDIVVVTINVTTQATPTTPTVIITPTPTPTPIQVIPVQETKNDDKKKDDKPKEEEKTESADKVDENKEKPEEQQGQEQAAEVSNDKKAPILVSNPDIKGWGAIESRMNSEPLAIDATADTVIPAQVIETAQATNTELILDVSSNAAWSIAPQSASNIAQDIDLGIKENTEDIPRDVIAKIAVDGEVEKEFTVNHEGKFGFVANLTLRFDQSKAGKMANLYYYNKAAKTMELVDSAPVNSFGEATFSLDHASSYAVILASGGVVSSGNDTNTENQTADKTEKSKENSGSKWWIWLIVAAVVLTVGGGVAIHIRKEKIKELHRRRRAQRMMHDGIQHHPKK